MRELQSELGYFQRVNDFRSPVDPGYASVLGYAIYIFTTYEWNVVWCGEKIEPGFLQKIQRKTSGKICGLFKNAIQNNETINQPLRARLFTVADRFQAAVTERNNLIHAKPCTDPEGRSSLTYNDSYNVIYWSPERIREKALMFESDSAEANNILHSEFKPF